MTCAASSALSVTSPERASPRSNRSSYNGLRLAGALSKREGVEMWLLRHVHRFPGPPRRAARRRRPSLHLGGGDRLDHLLRRRGLRNQVPMSLLTPEPFLSHMGMGGAGTIRQLLEAALEERDIAFGNPKGFVPVDDHYRHQSADGVYAADLTFARRARLVPTALGW